MSGKSVVKIASFDSVHRPPSADNSAQTFDPKDDPGKRCYFHNYGVHHGDGTSGCSKGKDCNFAHSPLVPKGEFATWNRPVQSGKATPKGGGKGGKGKPSSGKGTPKGKSKGKTPTVWYCKQYLKDGKCDRMDKDGACQYPHLNHCLLYTSPSPRDVEESRMPSSA